MIGIVAIFLDLFPAFIFVILPLLTSTPEKEGTQDKKSNNDNRNDDSNGCLPARTQSTGTVLVRILKCRVGTGWVCRAGRLATGGTYGDDDSTSRSSS